jgi:predicted outer membrane repeat protein
MFLTTNRLKEIDTAIASRIHVKIKYDALAQEQRRGIWEHFMGNGSTSQGPAIYSSKDLKYLVRKKA